MHGAQASLAQLVFDAEGEVGSVDADHHIRPGLDERADQALAPSQQLRQPAQHFDQAHYRQALHGEIAGQPFGLHARPTDADELDIRVPRPQRLHQSGPRMSPEASPATRATRNPSAMAQRVMPRVAL